MSSITVLSGGLFDLYYPSLVLGNALNATYTGGQLTSVSVGNLTAGLSTGADLNDLIGTWFNGTNDPSTSVYVAGSSSFSISYAASTLPLFAGTGPSINDINQGSLGDCYFVCGLGEVAQQDPTAIQNMIQENSNGTYSVRFYIDGTAEWVTVDNTLASTTTTFDGFTYTYQPFNNENVETPTSMWVNLIEKAYAELSAEDTSSFAINQNTQYEYGNSFSSIGNGGYPEVTIAQITGATNLNYLWSSPTDNNWQTDAVSAITGNYTTNPVSGVGDALAFNAIANAFNAGDDVVFGSYFPSYDASNNNNLELDSAHAFSVIGVNSSTQQIELRNPWGVLSIPGNTQSWDTTFWISLPQLASLEAAALAAGKISAGEVDYFAFDNTAPVVTAHALAASGRTQTFAASTLFTATDPTGIISSYTIDDANNPVTGGYFLLYGGPVTLNAGYAFTVTPSQLSSLTYVSPLAGNDDIFITANYGSRSSNAVETVISGPAYVPPTITANAQTLSGFESSIAASSLFSVVDNDGVAISALRYEITDNGGGGYFEVNGVVQANGSPFYLTATTLAETTYYANLGGGTDTISLTVSEYPGIPSSTTSFTITSPGLSVSGKTITQTPKAQSYAASSLFTSLDTGSAITSYTFDDQDTTAAAGYFLLNGVAEANGTAFTITASQLSALTYVSPIVGTDAIKIQATAGGYTTSAATTTVSGPVPIAPTLTVTNGTKALGAQSYFALSSYISATDNDGLPASDLTYTITGGSEVGGLILNGINLYTDTYTFTEAQLSEIGFQSVSTSGTQYFSVTVTDGAASATQTFSLQVNPAVVPTITINKTTLTGLETTVAMTSLFTVTGHNGVSVQNMTYYVLDNGANGYLAVNGVQLVQGQSSAALTYNQLQTVTYTAGLAGGTDRLTIDVLDGYASNAVDMSLTSPGLVVTGKTVTETLHAQSFSASSLFTASDGVGAIASYIFDDIGSVGGYFMLSGTKENASFAVTAARLANLTYVGPATGTDTITVAITGGGFTTPTSTITVNSPPPATPTITVSSLTLANEAPYSNFASLISVKDLNGVATGSITYTISFTGTGGVLDVNGVAETAGVSFTLNAAELSELSYVPSTTGGVDIIQISADDGLATGTATFKITTPVPPPGPRLTAKSATITAASATFVTDGTISVTDPNGVATSNLTYTLSYTGAGGALGLSGVAVAEGTSLTLSVSDLAGLNYTRSLYGGIDTFTLTASDEFGTSTPVTFALTTASEPGPTVSMSATTFKATSRDETFSLAQFGISAAPYYTSPVSEYQFEVIDSAGGVGSFLVGSTAQTNDSVFTVSAADTGTVSFQSVYGTEVIWVRASDGTGTGANAHWGAWVSATVVGVAKPAAPVVTMAGTGTTSKTITATSRNETFSYSQLVASTTVPSGVTASQYQFEVIDSAGGAGSFLIGDTTVEKNDAVFTVADPTTVSFLSIAGTEVIWVRANDGSSTAPIWGAWVSATIVGKPKTPAPVVTMVGATITATSRNETFSYSDLVASATPGTGTTVTQYQFEVTDGAGGIGSFVVGSSTVEKNDTVFTVTDLTTVSFLSIAGTEVIWVRANDGTSADPNWGAWASATIVGKPKTPAPVVTMAGTGTTSKTITATSRDETFSYSQLASVTDASTAAISQYQFEVIDSAGGIGSLLIGGTAQTNDLVYTVTDPTTVSFLSVAGTEVIWVRASDGTALDPNWGAWVSATINGTPKTEVPVVTMAGTPTASGKTITATSRDETLNYSQLVSSTTDASEAAISQYQFEVVDSAGGIGSFLVGGTVETNDTVFTVPDPTTVSFFSVAGTEVIWVRANDGTSTVPNWGAWVSATINGTSKTLVPVVTMAGTATTSGKTIAATSSDESFSFSQLVSSTTDASNTTVSQYQFEVVDSAGGVGSFSVGGVVQANDAVFSVNAANVGTMSFLSVSGTEMLWVRANDGTATDPNWGAWVSATMSGATQTLVPAITKTITATQDEIIPYARMFGATADASSAPISQYQLEVVDSAGGVGSLLVNGVAQKNDVVFSVSDPSTVSFQSVYGTEVVWVRANDGTTIAPNWGAWVETTMKGATSHPGPVFTPVSSTITTIEGGETVASPATLFNEVDAGGFPIAQYQFDDVAAAGSVGNFVVGSTAQANNTVFTVNASALGTVSYGFQSGSQVVWIRANDGTVADPNWGTWAAVTVKSPALTSAAAPVAVPIPNLSSSAAVVPLSSAAHSVLSPASLLASASPLLTSLLSVHHL